MSAAAASLLDILEPAFTGWSLLYLWVALSLITALVACRAARALKRRPTPPAPEPDESPADELHTEPLPLLDRSELAWSRQITDADGTLTLGVTRCGGRLAVLMDEDGRTFCMALTRADVQSLRMAVTGWLVETSEVVA